MMVKELIEKLEEQPSDVEVCGWDHYYEAYEIISVDYDKKSSREFPNGKVILTGD